MMMTTTYDDDDDDDNDDDQIVCIQTRLKQSYAELASGNTKVNKIAF